jgi:hypothetical protein
MRTHDGVRHVRSIGISGVHLETRGCQADGRRFPAIHGGQFDVVAEYTEWLIHLRRKPGFTYRSLSAYLKHRVWNAVEIEGVLYCSDGDWVERTSGERRIIDWAASRRLPPARAAA